MEENITHTTITGYGYGMLHLKKGPNHPGLIFSTLQIYFIQFFVFNLLLPSGYLLHMPPILGRITPMKNKYFGRYSLPNSVVRQYVAPFT